MANRKIEMSKVRQILRLFAQGTSNMQISGQAESSRNTVKKYIRKFIFEKMTFDTLSSMTDGEMEALFVCVEPPYKGQRYEQPQSMLTDLEKRFRQKGVTINMLWQHYLQTFPDGFGHTQYHKYFTDFTIRARPVMHLEHKAGDKMYIDYAGEKLTITDKDTGEIQLLEVFIAILECSQLTYVEAVHTQRR